MKDTAKEKGLKILEIFGLKVGDKIKLKTWNDTIYEITERSDIFTLKDVNTGYEVSIFSNLVYGDWEKLKPSIKDKKCKDFDGCRGCPFEDEKTPHINCCGACGEFEEKTLEQIYNEVKEDYDKIGVIIYGDE